MLNIVAKTNVDGFEVNCFNDVNSAVNSILENHLTDGTIAVAINPEKIITARTNSQTREAIEVSNFRYLDGMGAVWVASKKLGCKLSRIPGCELWYELMTAAAALRIPVFILGAQNEILVSTVKKLLAEGVPVVGASDGYFENEKELIEKIKLSGAKILTVALGSPKQELFMKKAKDSGLTCFMMGVGGTYDVYVGSVKRAPQLWCKLNLEWLYRLFSQPTRIFRQFNLLKFFFLAISNRI